MNFEWSKNSPSHEKNAASAAGSFRPEEVCEATVKLDADVAEQGGYLDAEFADAPQVDEREAAEEIQKRIEALRAFLQES